MKTWSGVTHYPKHTTADPFDERNVPHTSHRREFADWFDTRNGYRTVAAFIVAANAALIALLAVI